MAKLKSLLDLEELRKGIVDSKDPSKPCITLCSGTGCHAYASEKVADTFSAEL